MGYKFFGLLLILAFSVLPQTNVNGYLDTAWIRGCAGTNLTYTKMFPLAQYEDIRVICKADDTSETGFGSDLINFSWGYQTATIGLNRANVIDTFYSARTVVDTIIKTEDSTGTNGWLYNTDKITPNFDQYIRLFAQGISGNSTDSAVLVNFQVVRKIGTNVRSK